MAHHALVRINTGLEIYVCDLQSLRPRGSIENTNGLLRQYFPKPRPRRTVCNSRARFGYQSMMFPSYRVQVMVATRRN
jgi:IS30 family transposase